MQELEITVDITVQCEKCDAELSAEYNVRRKILKVTPCEGCLKKAYDTGFEEGYEEG